MIVIYKSWASPRPEGASMPTSPAPAPPAAPPTFPDALAPEKNIGSGVIAEGRWWSRRVG